MIRNYKKEDVKKWLDIFRGQDTLKLQKIEKYLLDRRIKWFEKNRSLISELQGNDIEKAYRLLLMKIGIREEDAPVILNTYNKIVFHSRNFCPSLEACKILGLDTRVICKAVFEKPTDALVKKINPKLRFDRNYNNIRPYTSYCEEIILLEQ
jgi:tRNA(adenine34) deaminase